MKKLFGFILIAAMFASCQSKDADILGGETETVVSFRVNTPMTLDKTTRAAILAPGATSDLGAVGNLDFDFYDVRYIMEVYNASGVHVASDEVFEADGLTSAALSVRLPAAGTYSFVFWADIVPEGTIVDYHYNTGAGLKAVKMNAYVGNNDEKDAYTAVKAINVTGTINESIVLTRPFGKIRVIATDADLATFATGDQGKMTYATNLPDTYNALNKTVSGTRSTVDFSGDLYEGDIAATNEKTLVYDYIFAPASGQVGYDFDVDVLDASNSSIAFNGQSRTLTNIPVGLNKLTTVKGNFFSVAAGFSIDIDDAFSAPGIDEDLNIAAGFYIGTTKYTTIADAISAAVAGDVIETKGTTTNSENIVLKAGVTLDGGNATFTGYIDLLANSTLKNLTSNYNSTATRTAINVRGTDVTIDGITMKTSKTGSNLEAIVTDMGAKRFTFTNSIVTANYWKGIYLNEAEGVEISGNTFEGVNPFSVDNFHATLTVENNIFKRTGGINTQMIHLIVGTDVDNTQASWDATPGLEDAVVQIKTANIWVEGALINANYKNVIRVNDKYVGRIGSNLTAWYYKAI